MTYSRWARYVWKLFGGVDEVRNGETSVPCVGAERARFGRAAWAGLGDGDGGHGMMDGRVLVDASGAFSEVISQCGIPAHNYLTPSSQAQFYVL